MDKQFEKYLFVFFLLTSLWCVSHLFTITGLYEFTNQSDDIFTFGRRILWLIWKPHIKYYINIFIVCMKLTVRFVNLATRTYSTPSECCCTSNVSNTLSKILPFFDSRSDVPFKYSMSSRKLPIGKSKMKQNHHFRIEKPISKATNNFALFWFGRRKPLNAMEILRLNRKQKRISFEQW